MKVSTLNCSNCGANLTYNLGDPIAYCQYCDSVNVFDFTQNVGVQDDANSISTDALKPRIMLPKEKFATNYFESGNNAQGGHLWIADTEIFFKPHAINIGDLSKKYMKIEDIVSMVKTNEMLGISKILTIKDKNGNSMKLVSWNRDKIISVIEKKKQGKLSLLSVGEKTGNRLCEYCGKQIENNSKSCKNCGANLTQTANSQVEQPTQHPNLPPPPTNENIGNIGATNTPTHSSGKKSKKGCLKWIGIFVVAIIAFIIALTLFNNEKTFSTLSEQEQEMLMTNLYDRLDKHFVSELQLNKQLAQLLVYEDETMSYFFDNIDKVALKKEGEEIGFKVGKEMMEISQKWATDNNIDFEDWVNGIGSEELLIDYMSHLVHIASEEAEEMMQEMKATLKKGLRQGAFDIDWIVGEWVPDTDEGYAESDVIIFDENGIFSTGDDCRTEGIYTIMENELDLNGTTECPDCPDCEISGYQKTIKIKENSLEGYKKIP